MSTKEREQYQAAVRELLQSRPVSYYPALARKIGGVKAAVMLSQLLYWNGDKVVQKRGGWFYKSVEEMEQETGLTKVEQQNARQTLVDQGIIEVRLKGIPRTWYYRVDWDALGNILIKQDSHWVRKSSNGKPTQRSNGNPPNDGIESSPILGEEITQLNKESETTSETTTEITAVAEDPERAPDPPAASDPPPPDLSSAQETANQAAFLGEGVGLSSAMTAAARLAHVTPEFIRGHAERLRHETRFTPSLLLHVVKAGDPLPVEWGDAPDYRREPDDRLDDTLEEELDEPPPAPPPPDNHTLDRLQAVLCVELPAWTYDQYVKDLEMHVDGSQVILIAGSDYARDWLESRMTQIAARHLAGILGREVAVEFAVREPA